MSAARLFSLNRIGTQIAILILVSLLTIHGVVVGGLILSRHGDNHGPFDDRLPQFVSMLHLIAAAPPAERARLIGDITRAFPHFEMKPAEAMPPGKPTADDDPHLRFIEQRLGTGFQLVSQQGTASAVAIRMPDGAVLTTQLPPRREPPLLGSPLSFTILFVLVSLTLLGLWAARALRTPLGGLVKAAEGFNLDGENTDIPETGPEEVREVAKAFNLMRNRIKKLVDDRTRLLAAMGHDLRTPITRLRLRSEFIADEELRRQMLRDLDQMAAMTDDVLSFLRDGQAGGNTTTVDLASLLQTVCDQFADMDYAVSYQGPNHATITARPEDLQRAVANLVDNAIRHGAQTVVRLTAEPVGVRIDVEDDGPGISDDRKDTMLEAFVRGEAARTMDNHAGFGLGLSIARAIAEAHGGSLTLHDRAPHGLIARITLPAAAPAAAAA